VRTNLHGNLLTRSTTQQVDYSISEQDSYLPNHQSSKRPKFQTTKVPNDQSSKRPKFQTTKVPSYQSSKLPCNRTTLQQVQESRNENQSARTEVQEPKNEKQSARTEERETKCENRRAKSSEQNPRSKKPQFFASLVVKLTRNPTFGISFCFAVDTMQVVLLWSQKFLAVCCASERSRPLFRPAKMSHEDKLYTNIKQWKTRQSTSK